MQYILLRQTLEKEKRLLVSDQRFFTQEAVHLICSKMQSPRVMGQYHMQGLTR